MLLFAALVVPCAPAARPQTLQGVLGTDPKVTNVMASQGITTETDTAAAGASTSATAADGSAGGLRPLKGYGDRKRTGAFRIFSTTLNCESFTDAFTCGVQSRGTAVACIWCPSGDVCVQGMPSSGPDAAGKKQLALKSIRCDSWMAA